MPRNPSPYFVKKMLGKISVLKYYSRQVTTYHIIVMQLIILKIIKARESLY